LLEFKAEKCAPTDVGGYMVWDSKSKSGGPLLARLRETNYRTENYSVF